MSFIRTTPSSVIKVKEALLQPLIAKIALIPVYDIAGNFAGTKSQDLGNARNPFADIYRTKDNQGI